MNIVCRPARREDVAAIVALLADDGLGASREKVCETPLPAYLAAYDAIAANPRALLAVAEARGGAVVGPCSSPLSPACPTRARSWRWSPRCG